MVAIVKPGSAERATSTPSCEQACDLIVVRRHMIEHGVEFAGQVAQILRKARRIENLRQPPEPDQPIDRGWKVDPAEWQLGGQMDAPGRDCRDRAPSWVLAYARRKIA